MTLPKAKFPPDRGQAPQEWSIAAQALGAQHLARHNMLMGMTYAFEDFRKDRNGQYLIVEDRLLYVDDLITKAIVIDERNETWHRFLSTAWSLDKNSPHFKGVTGKIQMAAESQGTKLKAHRYSWFNAFTKILYISNYDGRVWRLDGKNVDLIKNGQDVFFLDDDAGEPVDPTKVSIAPLNQLWTIIEGINYADDSEGLMTKEQRALAIKLWMLSLPFGALFDTRPILLFEGEKGAGKTTIASMIQQIVLGVRRPSLLVDDEQEFALSMSKTALAHFDNCDTKKTKIIDALCLFLSSGVMQRRKLYTDDQFVSLEPNAWTMFTSRSPMIFRRDDVADRTLMIRLQRFGGDFDAGILGAVELKRPELFGEYLYWLNKVVEAWREDPYMHPAPIRLASFWNVGKRAAKAIGADASVEFWDAMSREGEVISLDDDPMVSTLIAFAPKNLRKEFAPQALWLGLRQEAERVNLPFTYDSPRKLMARLRNLKTALERLLQVRIVERKIGGNMKIVAFMPWSVPPIDVSDIEARARMRKLLVNEPDPSDL